MEDISHWAPGKASVVCWSTKYIHEKECLKVVKNTFQKIQVCLNFSRGEWGGGGGGVFRLRGQFLVSGCKINYSYSV